MPLELSTGDDAAPMPRLLAALTAALEHSVRTQHPLFLNQLYARPEPAGIAGALHRVDSRGFLRAPQDPKTLRGLRGSHNLPAPRWSTLYARSNP